MTDSENTISAGIRHRPSSTSTTTPSQPETIEYTGDTTTDMAYGTLRNKSRPILATTIARASAAAASSNIHSGGVGGISGSGSFIHNRELRRYRDRILIVLFVAAIYTVYIYKSGMFIVSYHWLGLFHNLQ